MNDRAVRRSSGFLLVFIATAAVGVAGYVITWLVPRVIGFAPYATFAVFWAALFLIVAALSGIQQETTRTTIPRAAGNDVPARPSRFAGGAALAVASSLLLTAPLWVGAVFGDHTSLIWPLVVGCTGYALLAVLAGMLYAASEWRLIFALMTVEGIGRLAAIGLTLIVSREPFALVWAVALPIPLTAFLIWLMARKRLAGRLQFDAGYRVLAWNSARTIVAATSMGALVSGFPLLITLTSPGESEAQRGLLILIATLTRAPLIVVAMALQSYLIVFFRQTVNAKRALITLIGLTLVAGVALGTLGLLSGPAVFSFLYPAMSPPPGWLIAAMAGTSALVAATCVTAPAVLAQGKHSVFTAGWVAAAFGTTALLLLPNGLYERAALALLIGPAPGIAVHLVYHFGRRSSLTPRQHRRMACESSSSMR